MSHVDEHNFYGDSQYGVLNLIGIVKATVANIAIEVKGYGAVILVLIWIGIVAQIG